MRKTFMFVALLGALTVAAGIPFATPVAGGSPNLNPKIMPIDSKSFGKAYGEWSGAWWRWCYSIPAAVNPVADPTGANAALGQSGPVFFLAGTFGGPAERSVTVPAGKALFFPILNQIWINLPEYGDNPWSPEQEAFARALIAGITDGATLLTCEIDGQPVQDVAAYRCQTPPGKDYMVTVPEESIWSWLPAGTYGPTVDDGYYLMVAPLPVGEHTIHFQGEMTLPWEPYFFSLEVAYHLTVK
jgi:hypothetical protein